MGNLPIEVIRKYMDMVLLIRSNDKLNQLSAHIFVYRCSECFKEWGTCFVIAQIAEPILDFVSKCIICLATWKKTN